MTLDASTFRYVYTCSQSVYCEHILEQSPIRVQLLSKTPPSYLLDLREVIYTNLKYFKSYTCLNNDGRD